MNYYRPKRSGRFIQFDLRNCDCSSLCHEKSFQSLSQLLLLSSK
uniref:Uncharacterized protein n=1 Tax=Tetraselmis sp. GSL018 TaxID=582737 RepID=A0A061R2U5_9CHLO